MMMGRTGYILCCSVPIQWQMRNWALPPAGFEGGRQAGRRRKMVSGCSFYRMLHILFIYFTLLYKKCHGIIFFSLSLFPFSVTRSSFFRSCEKKKKEKEKLLLPSRLFYFFFFSFLSVFL
ncbi:hypothetical protein F5X96DRAFT_560049 [Biscogniauxia mediterranea]|nr:hypothetical protein F5X96DRAFT_560049 [Biscogniauxia mediterranea]